MRLALFAGCTAVLAAILVAGSVTLSSAKDVRGFPGAKAVMRAGPFEAVYEGRQRGLYPDWKMDGIRVVPSSPLNVPKTYGEGDIFYSEELRIRKKSIRLTQPLSNAAKAIGAWTVGTTFDFYANGRRGSYCRRDYRRNPYNVPAGFYCVTDDENDGTLDTIRFKGNSSAAAFEAPVALSATAYEIESLSEEVAWKRVLTIEKIQSDKIIIVAPIIDWVVVRKELDTFPSFRQRLEQGETDRFEIPLSAGKGAIEYEGARFRVEKAGPSKVMALRTADFAPWAETVRGRGVGLIETRFPVKP